MIRIAGTFTPPSRGTLRPCSTSRSAFEPWGCSSWRASSSIRRERMSAAFTRHHQRRRGRVRAHPRRGLSRSKVMDYATELIDGVGPRLTGSPNLKKAIDWAREELTQMGLSQVRAESWGEFGLGWEQRNVWVRMVAPDTAVFIAQAAPWSPATPGPVTADVRSVGGLPNEQAFAAHRGTLRDRIVLLAARQGRLTSSRSTSRCSLDSMMRSLRHTRACRAASTPRWPRRSGSGCTRRSRTASD